MLAGRIGEGAQFPVLLLANCYLQQHNAAGVHQCTIIDVIAVLAIIAIIAVIRTDHSEVLPELILQFVFATTHCWCNIPTQ